MKRTTRLKPLPAPSPATLRAPKKSSSSSLTQSIGWREYITDTKNPNFDSLRPEDVLNDARIKAHRAAYKLIKELSSNADWSTNTYHQIVTAESLTAGLILSTIVDVPFGGAFKYGCFGVYDTDAKRTYLGVKVENLYTHRCAREMAEGALKNSNASIAIAVSGNAMPNQGVDSFDEIAKLGEVFIGVAGYKDDKTILCETSVYNFCIDHSNAFNLCKLWHDTVVDKSKAAKFSDVKANIKNLTSGFNDYITTSFVSNYIRNKTAEIALKKAFNFVKKNKLAIPSFLKTDRPPHENGNNPCNNVLLQSTRGTLTTECLNQNCNDISRISTSQYRNSALLPYAISKQQGGKRSKRSKKTNKRKNKN